MDALRTREPQGQQNRFPTFRALAEWPRNNARVWARLLWKEWREAWPILLIGLVLPLLTLPLSKREGWGSLDYSVMGLVGILLVLWAADRARRIGMDRGQVRQALPVSLPTRWVFMYLVPLPVPVLTGIAIGIMMHTWHADWVPLPLGMLTGILYLPAVFFVVTLLTPTLSFIPAVILGVLWLFFGLDTERPDNLFPMFIKVIVACLLASLVWDAFAAKQRYWVGRTVMVVLLLVALIDPQALREISWPSRTDVEAGPQAHVPWAVVYPMGADWGRVVNTVADTSRKVYRPHATLTSVELQYYDRRERKALCVRSFKQAAQPLAFISEHQVLIGQQYPGESDIHLSVWDLQADRVVEKGRLTAEKKLLSSTTGAELSPDGRYLVIYKQGKFDPNVRDTLVDLWIADLARGRAVPVMMNIIPNDYIMRSPVSWTPDRLYLATFGGGIQVDLHTLRGRYLTLADFRRKP